MGGLHAHPASPRHRRGEAGRSSLHPPPSRGRSWLSAALAENQRHTCRRNKCSRIPAPPIASPFPERKSRPQGSYGCLWSRWLCCYSVVICLSGRTGRRNAGGVREGPNVRGIIRVGLVPVQPAISHHGAQRIASYRPPVNMRPLSLLDAAHCGGGARTAAGCPRLSNLGCRRANRAFDKPRAEQ